MWVRLGENDVRRLSMVVVDLGIMTPHPLQRNHEYLGSRYILHCSWYRLVQESDISDSLTVPTKTVGPTNIWLSWIFSEPAKYPANAVTYISYFFPPPTPYAMEFVDPLLYL